jgi:hypothetical protein
MLRRYPVTVPARRGRGRFVEAERWAIIEWMLVRSRLELLALLLLLLVLCAASGILLSIGLSKMSRTEAKTFVHRQLLYPRNNEGPIVERVPPE